MRNDDDGTIARTFKVLEYFDQVQRPLGVSEIAEHFDLPRSSTAALFATLVRLGYLTHDRVSRSYQPTFRLSELGRWVDKVLFGEDRATVVPFLARVCKEVHETVVLGIQDDLVAQYVHVELPDRPVLYLVKSGSTRPLCRSAVGWALLSTHPADTVARYVRRFNSLQESRDATVDPGELERTLERIRRRGYAFSKHSVMRGIGMIAMLLPSLPGRRQLAVGVGGPVERLEEKEHEIVRALMRGVTDFLTPAPSTPKPRESEPNRQVRHRRVP